jgi:hypothetical protein
MVASSGFEVLHWTMHTALHHRIAMVTKTTSGLNVFYVVVNFVVAHNLSKTPFKIKLSHTIVDYVYN